MTIGLDYQRIVLDENVKLLYRFDDVPGSTDTAQLVALRCEGQRRWDLGLAADNAPFAPIATSTALGTFTFIPNPEEIIRALSSKRTDGIYDDVRDYIRDLDAITGMLISNPYDTFVILEVSRKIRSERERLASEPHGFTVAFDDPVMLCTNSSSKGDVESTLVLEKLTNGSFRVLAEPVPAGLNRANSADRIELASSSPQTPLVFTELDDDANRHPLQLRSHEPLTTPMSVSEYLIASCQAHQIRTRPASDGFSLSIAEAMTSMSEDDRVDDPVTRPAAAWETIDVTSDDGDIVIAGRRHTPYQAMELINDISTALDDAVDDEDDHEEEW